MFTVAHVSIFQAKFQMDCECERRNVETSKNKMHEESYRRIREREGKKDKRNEGVNRVSQRSGVCNGRNKR